MYTSDKEICCLPWLGKGQEHFQMQDNLERGHKGLLVLATLNLSSPPPSPRFLVSDFRTTCRGPQTTGELAWLPMQELWETFFEGEQSSG